MKHFGDITKLNGADLPIVDIITGGSPCQDLSVAGKRAGLAGERSGLFMEQIRIIKEMREHDKLEQLRSGRANDDIRLRPRYMVWENVPGAFSSNGGEDFRAVLEETAKVAERDACIPKFDRGGWPHSGCIMGVGWSIAWRLHDAQFWGVPQRRKRIALVADFGGQSAPEILFEREGLSRHSSESGKEGQEVAGNSGTGVTETGGAFSFQERAGKPGEAKESSSSTIEQEPCQPSTINQYSQGINGDVAGTLDSNYYKGCGDRAGVEREVVYCLQGNGIDRADTAGCNGKGWREDKCYTLTQDAYDKFSESDNSATLKAEGGSYGGGSETLVIQ